MLLIDRFPFPGTVLHVTEGVTLVQHRLLHFWALQGAALLNGQRKHRTITVRHLVHAQYTEAQLNADKSNFAAQAGRTGVLAAITDNRNVQYPDCLFLGWEAEPDPASGPLPDVAGTLDGGWWQILNFLFVQLSTNP